PAARILFRTGEEGRATNPRAERIAGAADGDLRGPARHLELARRSEARVRDHAGERDPALRGKVWQSMAARGKCLSRSRNARLEYRVVGAGTCGRAAQSSSRPAFPRRRDQRGTAHYRPLDGSILYRA